MPETKSLLLTDRRKIREHWKKSDAQIKLEIGMIKNWFKTQKHLPETPCDDTIEYFLTNCKFSIEKAKRTLDMYYTIRNLLPEIYVNKHPSLEHMKSVRKWIYLFPMPHLTEGLHRITVMKFKDMDPEGFQVNDYAAANLRNLFEIKHREDLTLGEIFILDLEHFKLGHMIKFTPMYIKKCAFIIENVWANRLKAIHIVNSLTFLDTILALARACLSKKLQERVYVQSNTRELLKVIPQELLPSDYGGNEPSLDEFEALWEKKFEEYKDRFDEMENLQVNEELRPEKLVNHDILGFHGNFKTIEID